MKIKYLALIYITLCSCSVTTTSGGKHVEKGPKEVFEEQKNNTSDAFDTLAETEKNDSTPAPNPEDSYKKASDDANIVYVLKSNWERTHFFIDGIEMGIARELKVKINNQEHTVVAKPDNCISKEENIRPPYDHHAPLRFTFLIGECKEIKSVATKKIITPQHKATVRNRRPH
ncbi:hypothetical protein [Methylobacter tundripaludum]|uniref:hypothetical protein n=1 Tax=Methylobacter tundripaludum TaxID=173365 RepID=UPI000484F406|nr:hypothetical protein [Methylobacter tundripaludum]